MNLKQKDMNVVVYTNKFDHLSRYVPLLVATPEARVLGLNKGLDHHISYRLVAHNKEPMERVLYFALKWELKVLSSR